MDVHHEGVRPPSAHLSDLDVRALVEVHGHSTTSSKRVAADIPFLISKLEQAKVFGCFLESCVDIISGDVAVTSRRQKVGVDARAFGATILENVVDSSSQRFDWAGVGSSAFNVDGFTLDSILLISNPEGGLSCSLKLRPRRIVGDDVVLGISKSDIGNSERLGLSSLGLFGILTHP